MTTVAVKPELIRWAIDRSRLTADALKKFPIERWKSGEKLPTFKQLEEFAKKTMTPLGYLFLPEPPVEQLPIPDFRTRGDTLIKRPSPDLIDTLHDIQRRQDWIRDELIEKGHDPLPFVGSSKRQSESALAERIRQTLLLSIEWAETAKDWEDAYRKLRRAAENAGIFVAASGIVGLNTHRKLDPQEFRGFVLCDNYAPFVFINSADSNSAQMFTLAHELAHVWLGQGGLFNLIATFSSDDATEKYCNRVAAEFLVPASKVAAHWDDAKAMTDPFRYLARRFKVSPIVAARRALDLQLISRSRFFAFYAQEQAHWLKKKADDKEGDTSGPDFYVVQPGRLSRRFVTAVARATRDGRLPMLEAYRLTGLRGATFDRLSNTLLAEVNDE